MRLQTFLSHNGIASRRKAFDLIQAGHVKVNSKVVREPSTVIDPKSDKIFYKDKPVQSKSLDYVLLNKPSGCVTTKKDRHASKTVFDLLPSSLNHLVPVGRLDKDTRGLLLLTNDGDLTYRLTHPKFNIDKTYFVKIIGDLPQDVKGRLQKGVIIEGKKTHPAKIKDVKSQKNNTSFLITIHEGRKRQVRVMLGKVDRRVVYLKRIIQGPIELGRLKEGSYRHLTQKEVTLLKRAR